MSQPKNPSSSVAIYRSAASKSSKGGNGTPAGVTETQYRRALEQVRASSNSNFSNSNTGSTSNYTEISNGAAKASIDAAALQSEMARRFNLPGASNKRNIIARGSNTASAPRPQHKSTPNPNSAPTNSQQIISCASCHLDNHASDIQATGGYCRDCGYYLRDAFLNEHESTDFALRRGLIKAAPKSDVITVGQWVDIEAKLEDRVDAFCPICMVGFNQGSEVLLSCTHIFHRACLQSFERFNKNNVSRCCPMCRTSDYQKKITHLGSKAFQIVCINRIQSLFRGYQARKKYYVGLKFFYRLGKGDNRQRKKFYEKELLNYTNSMIKEVDGRKNEIDSMLSASDSTLEESRQLDILFEQMLRQRQTSLSENSHAMSKYDGINSAFESQAVLEFVHRDYSFEEFATSDGSDALGTPFDRTNEITHDIISKEEWNNIKMRATSRGFGECAICMSPNLSTLHINKEYHAQSSLNLYLLNCTHIFHVPCIGNLEKFAKSMKQQICCPVCRAIYVKKLL